MPRVISNLEFRCWASCPSQGDTIKSRQSHHELTRLVCIDINTNQLPSKIPHTKARARAAKLGKGYYEDMGFFSSSRKAEDRSVITTVNAATPGGDRTMVQVIRSRFYGKKGKEREEQSPVSSSNTKLGFGGAAGRSTTSILLPPPSISAASTYDSIGASPRPSTSQQRPPIPTSILQKSYPFDDRPLPATPQKKTLTVEVVPGLASSIRSRHAPSTPSKAKKGDHNVISSPATPNRKNADSVTVTLAQRLNELAVANSEGLLNDDEYRLLRQSLFDRFAGTAVVPQEEAMVPAARPRPPKPNPTSDSRSPSRPLSNFQVEMPRPTSVHSRHSMSFGVSELVRKATTRRSSSVARDSDTASIWSAKSSSSKLFRIPRALSKKSSNSSINTTGSKAHGDTISISSKRGGAGNNSDKGHSDSGHHHSSSSGLRSAAGSVRRIQKQTPPSSFPTRAIGQDAQYSHSVRDVFDEEALKTAQDIRKEILAVEGEQRRLMDAFNGLEITTLSKSRRHHQARPSGVKGSESNAESPWGGSETRSHKRFYPTESDALSIRSGTSIRTTPSVAPSIARSAYSSRNKTLRAKGSHPLNSSLVLPSPSSSLHRKDSSSSFASDGRRYERGHGVPPPVPALPLTLSHGHLRAANSSSISLARSTGHLPMDVVHEDEDRVTVGTVRMDEEEEDEPEHEMDDIRRRREEVNMRYEARLEYLKAKLKGAQLHEKLLKK